MIFKKFKNGFTILELLVAIAISGLVIAACYQLFIVQTQFASKTHFTTTGQQDLRTAVDIMAHNIEKAAFNLRKENAFASPLVEFADPSTQIGFYIDFEEDADTGSVGEYVEYHYEASKDEVSAKVSSGSVAAPFLSNVNDFTISYYSDLFDDTVVTEPYNNYDRIERIVIEITVQIKDPTKDETEWETRSIKREVVPFNLN